MVSSYFPGGSGSYQASPSPLPGLSERRNQSTSFDSFGFSMIGSGRFFLSQVVFRCALAISYDCQFIKGTGLPSRVSLGRFWYRSDETHANTSAFDMLVIVIAIGMRSPG